MCTPAACFKARVSRSIDLIARSCGIYLVRGAQLHPVQLHRSEGRERRLRSKGAQRLVHRGSFPRSGSAREVQRSAKSAVNYRRAKDGGDLRIHSGVWSETLWCPRREDSGARASSRSFSRHGMRSGAALGFNLIAASAKRESFRRRRCAASAPCAPGVDSTRLRAASAKLLAPTSGRNSPVPGWYCARQTKMLSSSSLSYGTQRCLRGRARGT